MLLPLTVPPLKPLRMTLWLLLHWLLLLLPPHLRPA
jgi:hypothetical protein